MRSKKELNEIKRKYFIKNHPYKMVHWSEFDFSILDNIFYQIRKGNTKHTTFNECIIMADTETSKKQHNEIAENHVCAWTISIRAFNINLVTLYGHKPSTMMKAFKLIQQNVKGYETFIYFHNLAYDWQFLRKFFFRHFGYPEKQLNTKSHYPIYIKFDNGITLKDSFILAQRSLEKWADDMDVEHKKSVGKWDYDKIRNQDCTFSADEIEYIEHDTLAGVECIDALLKSLNKNISSVPYTATGIPRQEVIKRGQEHSAKRDFNKQCLDFEQYKRFELVFHGGYTHCNRYFSNKTVHALVKCYDFASSYPYCMLAYKYPAEKFTTYEYGSATIEEILSQSEEYAFTFKLTAVGVELKDYYNPMPALQFSKCIIHTGAVLDNGRILSADGICLYLNEIDLQVIAEQYNFKDYTLTEVEFAYKDYLPRWFTDYVFECFRDKTMLKGGDAVAYALAKSKLNSLYGMCVQKSIKQNIEENYQTGEYTMLEEDESEIYAKYLRKRSSILLFQHGAYVTSYAFRNLFKLGKCCKHWIYSDTDSCYGYDWYMEALNDYNEHCKRLIRENGYDCVYHNDREYWLGIAELDGEYKEFRAIHSKAYAARTIEGKLKITLAGVPKKGVDCLKDDINNFKPHTIFDGKTSGKNQHTYFNVEDIYTDEYGNECGDSIDLSPCDYLLNTVNDVDFDRLFTEEVGIQIYE